MKTKWEFHPNPHCATLHTDRLLPEVRLYENPGHELHQVIMGIEGIQEYSTDRYELIVNKAHVFEWGTLCKRIESALEELFGK